jgi:2-hydroxy-6-oxo-6-(2'-carboxyphenyl)-hexa-2,4-dienoate hydrolase
MGEAKFVNVDGIRTRYFEGGSGEAMVLIHADHFGETGSCIRWIPIFPSLAAHYHVYAVDKLGMGLTDNPLSDSGYSMQATVQHIYRFMETLGIENSHLVGHSRGALPATRIALDHQDRVKTLTIFDSNTLAPGDPPPVAPNIRDFGPPPTKDSIRQKLLADRSTFRKDFITDEYVEAELEVASHPKIRQAAERLELLRKRFIERTLDMIRAGRLQTPTLIIWGFNDPSATYEMAVDLFQLISKSVDQAQLHFFNQSRHYPFHEYPREVVDLMVSFTESVEG